jgi:hypothetical protein
LRSRIRDINAITRVLEDAIAFVESSACEFVGNNKALLLGSWGTGKTHFLCDLTQSQMLAGKIALIVLAKNFAASPDPLTALCNYTELTDNFPKLLLYLNDLYKATGERALLIVDGINESDRVAWRSASSVIVELFKQFPNVGLILSCRGPFDEFIFDVETRNHFVELKHPGFEEQEFDAQAEFFRYYDIPLPEVPLLADEFSRPLALKIICEALQGLSAEEKKKGINGIASGQKGMTYI